METQKAGKVSERIIKARMNNGYTVHCDVYDDKNNNVGEFIFICSYCGFEYFRFGGGAKKLYCVKCGSGVGYKLEREWKRPKDTPGRKHLGFYTDGGLEYVWTCHCNHDLHNLINDLTYTECEGCHSKTSRRKDITTISSKATWAI